MSYGAASNLRSLPSKPADGVMIGYLVKLDNGQKALYFGRFMDGHKSLENAIRTDHPGHQIAEKLWAGEVRVDNGKILAANETSGLLKSGSNVNELKTFLEENRNHAIAADNIQYIKWDQTQGDKPQHLLAEMNEFGVDLRHDLPNLVNPTVLALEIADVVSQTGGNVPELLQEVLNTKPDSDYAKTLAILN